MIEIWSDVHRDPLIFILLIIWLILAQVGGLLSNVFSGGGEMVSKMEFQKTEKTFWKICSK